MNTIELSFSMKSKQKCVNHKIIYHAISDYILAKGIVFTKNVNFHESMHSKKKLKTVLSQF